MEVRLVIMSETCKHLDVDSSLKSQDNKYTKIGWIYSA